MSSGTTRLRWWLAPESMIQTSDQLAGGLVEVEGDEVCAPAAAAEGSAAEHGRLAGGAVLDDVEVDGGGRGARCAMRASTGERAVAPGGTRSKCGGDIPACAPKQRPLRSPDSQTATVVLG